MRLGPALLLAVLLSTAPPAGAEEAARLGPLEPGRWEAAGFALARPVEISVTCGVVAAHPDAETVTRTWILDADTREVVWRNSDGDLRPTEDPVLRLCEARVALQPGDYELYLAVAPEQRFSAPPRGLGEALGLLLKGKEEAGGRVDAMKEAARAVTAAVEAPAGALGPPPVPGRGPDGALLRLAPVADGELRHARFRLVRSQPLGVYALVELTGGLGDPTDTAWIETEGRRVLELDRFNTAPAGGADKNRVHRGVVELPAGTYDLFYGSDDSHAYGNFNDLPPHDPYGWGVCLLPGPGFDASAFEVLATEAEESDEDVLLAFRGVGDDEFLEQCFRVTKDGTLSVVAVGETASGGFVDGGWIVDLDRAQVVWRMEERGSVHAGGNARNRRCSEEIVLPPGDYAAYYATDGSHSNEGWHGGAPFVPAAWGLTVRRGTAEAELIPPPPLDGGQGILVALVRRGDDETVQREFRLEEPAEVAVLCVGEASGDEVFDGAWIEDDAGATVWQAVAGEGFHAGGSDKNRRWETRLSLPAGRYVVHWRSDGSHSWTGFNSRPPWLPERWGITVLRLD